MIVVKDVFKKYKNIILFENLNVEIPTNKRILIKGINGSGKSVFLKMLVGYSKPNSGKILIDNKLLGADFDFIPNAGVSINAPEFLKNMTGMENLEYLSNIRKIVNREQMMSLVKKFDLDKDIYKRYKNYSLGMKQKLRIIQAMMEEPKYLILDEPFDALDKKSQKTLLEILNDYVLKGNTLIFTSHNSEFEKFADIIYEIDNFQLIRTK